MIYLEYYLVFMWKINKVIKLGQLLDLLIRKWEGLDDYFYYRPHLLAFLTVFIREYQL